MYRASVVLLAILVVGSGSVNAGTSSLWGKGGEAYQPRGQLLDFSWSGYRANRGGPIPAYLEVANVLDFGAKPDDEKDDTAAINAAIQYAKEQGGGAVVIPAGTFIITKRIIIDGPNIALKGAGSGQTIIKIPITLDDVDPGDMDYLEYSWDDGWISVRGEFTSSSESSNELAKVTRNVGFGLKLLYVSDASKFKPNMMVKLYMSNPKDNSLAREVYNNQVDELCSYKDPNDCIKRLENWQDLIVIAFTIDTVSVEGGYVTLQQRLPLPVKTAWSPVLHRFQPNSAHDSGVEGLTLMNKWAPAYGHHIEKGANGVYMSFCYNCWIKDVHVVNADTGFLLEDSHWVSIDNVTMSVTKTRATSQYPWEGHIGIGYSVRSSRNMATGFDINGYYIHGITAKQAYLNVWRKGKGSNLSVDYHRQATFGNLVSDVDLGLAKAHLDQPIFTYKGGKKDRGFTTGSYTTHWNVRQRNKQPLEVQRDAKGTCDYGTRMNWVGLYSGTGCTGWVVERMNVTVPRELVDSQIAYFKKPAYIPIR